MAQPKLEFLTAEEVESIHFTSLKILEETGVIFPVKEALGVFHERGAKVNHETGLVKIPPDIVEEAIAKVPSGVTLFARDPKYDVPVQKETVTFGTIGNATHVLDLETGERRRATNRDLADITRVIDACQNILHLEPQVTPQDVPKEASYQYSWATTLKNTVKHVRLSAHGKDGVQDGIKMGSAIAGGQQALKTKPFISFMALIPSPLAHDPTVCEGFMEAARLGFPIWFESGPVAGASAPVTLAGALALNNAEVLSGIVLAQLVRPGTPVIYGSFLRIMDMRTGNVSISSPEFCIFRPCIASLARYYKMPSWAGVMLNDAKIIDCQAGYEKALSALMSALGGVNLLCGMQLDNEHIVSAEDMVVNDEIVGAVLRILRGFDVNKETLALEVIDEIGPRGVFLRSRHTMDHYRRELWSPSITERSTWTEWKAKGEPDMWKVARERTKKILKTHQREPLSHQVASELDAIAREAAKRLVKT